MLYHAEIGIPFTVSLPPILDLFYSDHAKAAAKNDRLGQIRLRTSLKTDKVKIIEVETCNRTGEPIKVLVRQHHDNYNDVCLAISLRANADNKFLVKTVWLNDKHDLHRTLDTAKYQQVS